MTESKPEWVTKMEDAATKALGEILQEIEQLKCFVCDEPAQHKKMAKDLCTYHYDLANDHYRGRK